MDGHLAPGDRAIIIGGKYWRFVGLVMYWKYSSVLLTKTLHFPAHRHIDAANFP